MSGPACPITTCHGHIILVGHDPDTGERLGICDACDETVRQRQGIWMDRDEPFLPPPAPTTG